MQRTRKLAAGWQRHSLADVEMRDKAGGVAAASTGAWLNDELNICGWQPFAASLGVPDGATVLRGPGVVPRPWKPPRAVLERNVITRHGVGRFLSPSKGRPDRVALIRSAELTTKPSTSSGWRFIRQLIRELL